MLYDIYTQQKLLRCWFIHKVMSQDGSCEKKDLLSLRKIEHCIAAHHLNEAILLLMGRCRKLSEAKYTLIGGSASNAFTKALSFGKSSRMPGTIMRCWSIISYIWKSATVSC